MRYRKRALLVLLALTMTFLFIPVMAFADTTEGISLYYRSGDTTDHKSTDGSINLFTGTSTEKPMKMGVANKSVVWYELNTTSSSKEVTWSTSDAGVVAFDASGKNTITSKGTAGTGYLQARCVKIYARGAGNASITVEYTNENGTFSDSVNVIVKDPVDPNSIGALNDINIKVGETIALTPPSITPENAEYKQAVWTVTNSSLVSNNQKEFTGKKAGTSTYSYTITKYNGAKISATANITISEAEKKIRIGDKGYDTLEAAFGEAKAGDTIQIDEHEINIDSPIAVSVDGTIRVSGGETSSDDGGSVIYTGTPTIKGNIFTVTGSKTQLVLNNICFKNEPGYVMSISDGAQVTLNEGSVTGNAALSNGGKLSISGSNVFTGDVTTTDEGERTIKRNDFGDVTITKGGNKVLTNVNNKITGNILGDALPSKIIKVTFKVISGAWNDGTSTDEYATLTGGQDDELKLSAANIPSAGEKPLDNTYMAGSWDTEPNTETEITRDTIYTYTYIKKDAAVVKNDPAAKSLKYNGSAQELVTAGKAEGGKMQYALGGDATTVPETGWGTSIPAGKDIGDYYVWYKAVGDETHVDSDPTCVAAKISRGIAIPATVTANNRKYDGAEKPLVTVTGKAVGGAMKYALGKDAKTIPEAGWNTSIPAAKEIGDYYVWCKAAGDADYDDSEPLCVKVSISEEEPDHVEESTITFDLNGGTLDGMTGKVEIIAENGDVITLPAPKRDGYIFDYWEGSKYYAGDRYTVNGDHTFKAVWKTGAGGDGNKGGSSKNGVNTGDENTLGAWIMLLTAALTGTAGMIFARKKNNN